MKRVFLIIFLSILFIMIILERKSNFTIGGKYTYNNALVNSIVSNSYNLNDSKNYTSKLLSKISQEYKNIRSKKEYQFGLKQVIGLFSKSYNKKHRNSRIVFNKRYLSKYGPQTKYAKNQKESLKELLRKKKLGILSLNEEKRLKSFSNRNIKRYTAKDEENYENSFKKSLKNNNVLKSLEDASIDRYRRMAELRIIDKKSGLVNAFKKRDKAKSNKNKLETRKRRIELNKSKLLAKYNNTQTKSFEEILVDPTLTKKQRRELRVDKKKIKSYNKNIKKFNTKIQKATLKLRKKNTELTLAKEKAKNARNKYDKPKSKKSFKLGKKKIGIAS